VFHLGEGVSDFEEGQFVDAVLVVAVEIGEDHWVAFLACHLLY
jgi:hypothetical protein